MCLLEGVASLVAEFLSVVMEDPLYFEAMIVEDVGHQDLTKGSGRLGGSERQC